MKKMERRKFLQVMGAAALVGAAGALTGCGPVPGPEQNKGDGSVSLASMRSPDIWNGTTA